MTPSPSPSPTDDGNWLTINGPLIVVPDGSWQLLISALALVVSATALWFALAAAPRVRALAVRSYLTFDSPGTEDPTVHHDGDEVTVVNLGRAALVLEDLRALTKDGRRKKAAAGPRGFKSKRVKFPTLPISIPPGGVLTAWFPTALAGEKAGLEHGYEVTTLHRGGFLWLKTKRRKIIVKATEDGLEDLGGVRS